MTSWEGLQCNTAFPKRHPIRMMTDVIPSFLRKVGFNARSLFHWAHTRQSKTLESIYNDPVSANIVWKDIESLLNALGCEITEGKSHIDHIQGISYYAFIRNFTGSWWH